MVINSCMSAFSEFFSTEWVKNNDTNKSDVLLGSYMETEICSLVGLYFLFNLLSIDSLLLFDYP